MIIVNNEIGPMGDSMTYRFLFLACVCLLSWFSLFASEETFAPYFAYSPQELQSLKSLQTDAAITKKELQKWDLIIAEAAKEEEPASLKLTRLYTYLYVAQAEAAFLSYHLKGSFAGSLDPVSFAILKLFFPSYPTPADFNDDAYSKVLAKMIVEKMQERIKKEDDQKTEFKVPKEKEFTYVVGLKIAKWIPWYTQPIAAYWPSPPPNLHDSFWQQQVEEIKRAQTPLTEKKKEAIYFWAGIPNPASADWRVIANEYLFTHPVSLLKTLRARSLIMIGLYDGLIIGFSAKYHFLVMRPQELDQSVRHEIPVPKHPSYPANHALLATTSATILSHFFPEESKQWNDLANQAGLSRIWAGIHYPIDIIKGEEMGKKIGQHILNQSKS
jgi:hypothetical protein